MIFNGLLVNENSYWTYRQSIILIQTIIFEELLFYVRKMQIYEYKVVLNW